MTMKKRNLNFSKFLRTCLKINLVMQSGKFILLLRHRLKTVRAKLYVFQKKYRGRDRGHVKSRFISKFWSHINLKKLHRNNHRSQIENLLEPPKLILKTLWLKTFEKFLKNKIKSSYKDT